MPHFVLEYTGNITTRPVFSELFLALHALAHELADAEVASCKSRAIELKEYFVGDGNEQLAFVHLDISLLSGRPQMAKESLGNSALQLLKEYFESVYHNLCPQFTVKINDMPRELYFK